MRTLLTLLLLIFGGAAMADDTPTTQTETREAIFAGGCFWCLEPPFDNQEGVSETIVGYTGGTVEDPTYEQIGTGKTGHREAIAIFYDPAKVSFAQLVDIFFDTIDPYDAKGQFADKGPQYTTALYYKTPEEKAVIEAAIAALQAKSSQKVATVIEPASRFWPAEDYHQDYYQKNPLRYNLYKNGSGR